MNTERTPRLRRPCPPSAITTIRVPVPMRERLAKAAALNGRSEGAEIRSRLELSFMTVPIAG